MSAEIIQVVPASSTLVPITHRGDHVSDAPVDSRLGWIVVALFFGVFLGFACIIRLDAAAYAEGSVKVSGSRQVVQHQEGGIVSALHVREGQHVKAGDVLIELGGAEVTANERALAAQVIGMEAQRARLVSERDGAATIARPAEFAGMTGQDEMLVQQAMATQANELRARRMSVSSQKRVLSRQTAELEQRITGFNHQIDANDHQSSLYNEELAGMRDLEKQGYASANRVRALERAQAGVSGETANIGGNAASAREQIGETRMKALTLDSQQMQEVSEKLSETTEKLADTLPKWIALKKQVEQTRIRATSTGQVVGLTVFTVGGVIQAGQKLMEIVPDAVPLVIEMTVSPNDADDLYVGQKAEVRFTSLHERDLPVFDGTVTRLSADSFTDEKNGSRYFTGEVTVPAKTFEDIKRIRGAEAGLKPGLPAQVLVPLRKRTLLQYLVEPFNQALWRSGREH